MPAYIAKAVTKFQHQPPSHPQHLPHKCNPIKYGVQVSLPKDNAPLLSPDQCKHVQKIVGILLYYSQAMDPTLAYVLSSIAAKHANGTTSALEACHQLLDYVATHPHAAICHHASKMILAVHADASYLSEPDSTSCIGGHYFLTDQDNNTPNNGAILTLAAIIKHVVSFASEAEPAALFYNCKNAAPLWQTLEEMGHHQPKTIVATVNSTVHGLITNTMVAKASKAMDVRLNWLKCCQAQHQLDFQWQKN